MHGWNTPSHDTCQCCTRCFSCSISASCRCVKMYTFDPQRRRWGSSTTGDLKLLVDIRKDRWYLTFNEKDTGHSRANFLRECARPLTCRMVQSNLDFFTECPAFDVPSTICASDSFFDIRGIWCQQSFQRQMHSGRLMASLMLVKHLLECVQSHTCCLQRLFD